MNKYFWLIISFLAILADLIAIQWNESYRYFTKPMIVTSLIFYFFLRTSGTGNFLRYVVLAALVFSLGGDVLLMFEGSGSLFFLLGLSSFLIAHVFYIVAFNYLRKQYNIPFHPVLLLPVIVYYTSLIVILYGDLNEMRIPVMIYGLVISTMMVLALHLKISRVLMMGALLFVISDSVLAFNRFYNPWDGAGVLIMLTYGMAQLFLIYSLTRCLLVPAISGKVVKRMD